MSISYQRLVAIPREDGKHPTMIGQVFLHERRTQPAYSLLAEPGSLLKLTESNGLRERLMEEGEGSANESFERATHVL